MSDAEIIRAFLDANAEPSEAMIEAGALALWRSDKQGWVSPDYSQHEAYLRIIAKTAGRAIIAALRKDIV